MPGVRAKKPHSIPSFYACYLLKSIQTPRSKAVYIGSTPSPPRRIRQHNGELTQGAWKTRNKRPWIMQMIVHGFPSRLAALQFEWAWQHPNRSRHLRDSEGKAIVSRSPHSVRICIKTVKTMISTHPFNKWPLHVKLFTQEAVDSWNAVKDPPMLLPGFTTSIELEGVDGKSGHPGSGRRGPIDVKNETFRSSFLAKHKALLASEKALKCSICNKGVHDYTTNPLASSLCPSSSCVAVSHLLCLSKHFLDLEKGSGDIIPRGGQCIACGAYTLWGDVVRGCHCRAEEDIPQESEELEEEDDLNELDEATIPEMSLAAQSNPAPGKALRSTTQLVALPVKKRRKPQNVAPLSAAPRLLELSMHTKPKSAKRIVNKKQGNVDGESFNFHVNSSSDDEPVQKTNNRPAVIAPGSSFREFPKPTTSTGLPKRKGKRQLHTVALGVGSEHDRRLMRVRELFDNTLTSHTGQGEETLDVRPKHAQIQRYQIGEKGYLERAMSDLSLATSDIIEISD